MTITKPAWLTWRNIGIFAAKIIIFGIAGQAANAAGNLGSAPKALPPAPSN